MYEWECTICLQLINKNPDYSWNWQELSKIDFSRCIQNEREQAATIIQRKFLDWYYKPVCKDGTYGLKLKNDLEYIQKYM